MPAALLRIEDAAYAAQGATLMVGGQNAGLERSVIGVAAWVLAAALTAGFAAELLLAVLGFAVADHVEAAAVIARECSRNHAQSMQQTT